MFGWFANFFILDLYQIKLIKNPKNVKLCKNQAKIISRDQRKPKQR